MINVTFFAYILTIFNINNIVLLIFNFLIFFIMNTFTMFAFVSTFITFLWTFFVRLFARSDSELCINLALSLIFILYLIILSFSSPVCLFIYFNSYSSNQRKLIFFSAFSPKHSKTLLSNSLANCFIIHIYLYHKWKSYLFLPMIIWWHLLCFYLHLAPQYYYNHNFCKPFHVNQVYFLF